MSEELRTKYLELIGQTEHIHDTVQSALDSADQLRKDIEDRNEDLPDSCN